MGASRRGVNGKFGLDSRLDWPYNSPKMLIPPHKVQEICERFLAGEKKTEIARHMGISKFQVTAILAGKSRPEVGRPQEMSDPADKILEIHQAEIIRLVRLYLGISQTKFGQDLGVDYGTVSKWENGVWKMNPSRRRAFLNYLQDRQMIQMVRDFTPLRKEGYQARGEGNLGQDQPNSQESSDPSDPSILPNESSVEGWGALEVGKESQ